MLDAITSIEEFSEGISSAEDLRNRRLERAGIERMLTIIGEAAKKVSPEL
ncbi:HepT-like ribonuclease domain-containing protein [Methanoculleus bourgensis]|nr:HepT-like ribonuclease domain-containing protein [Methanoculleus bourgensis]